MTNQLPNGWINAPIGDLCELINGRAFKPTEWKDSGLPIIRIQNLNNANATFNYFDGEVLDKHKVKTGNLLFAWSGTPGTSFGAHVWKGSNAVLNQHIFKIDFSESLISKNFFHYAINQKLDELVGNAQGGVGLRHVTKGTFEKTALAFPPLAEQKEIATLLDNLLAQVDTLKTRLDAIPNILKRFRQSVLAAAVSGKLTEIEKNWEIVKLKDVATSRLGKMLDKQKNQGEPRLYLRNVNVRWNDFDLSDVFEMRMSDEEAKELIVKKGDILICEGGEPGRCAIWKDDNEDYVYQKALHNVRVGERLIPEWLCLVIKDSADSNKLDEYFTGTTIKHFTGKALKEFSFPFPPIEEQTEIVHRVESLFAFADQIEQRVKVAQQRVNHLTQAILAKAFRGELTAEWREQNPELISGENSAAALLARIQSERKKSAS